MAKRNRAFTLIELMVVVVVMALIAAVLVPAAISMLQRSEASAPAEEIAQAPPSISASARMVRSNVKVKLEAKPVLDGFRVQNEYRAAFEGTFVVERVATDAETISVAFPFPPGTSEAQNVGLWLVEEGRMYEPPGVSYLPSGIEWSGRAPAGSALTFVMTYEAIGRDAFTYDVASGGRIDEIEVEVVLANAPEVEVPAGSLAPTEVKRDGIRWKLERAVSSRPIIVELPAGSSSLGKLIQLFQLAAIGVLSFGAGFWYLAERTAPGRLDGFRWGDFLLLALDYSLFFAVFGVVVYGGAPPVAFGIAALVSLPLLMLHVSRVIDVGFAVRSVLPLAMYSLATVVGAVYLTRHRALVLLGAAILAIAYVTATYRGFVAKRKAHAAEKLQRAIDRALATIPPGWEVERSAITKVRSIDELERMQAHLHASIYKAKTDLTEALARLDREMEAARALLAETTEGESPVAAAARTALEATMARAEEIRKEAAEDGAPKELAARADRTASRLSSDREALAAAMAAVERRRESGGAHCIACGSAGANGSAYCPDCGTPRPHAIDCGGCGATLRVPVQLVKKKWRSERLHCERCGGALLAG